MSIGRFARPLVRELTLARGGALAILLATGCRLPSLDFDEGTFTDTIDLPTSGLDDITLTAEGPEGGPASGPDGTATDGPSDTSGDPPPPLCGFEGFGGAALTWSRTVEVEGVELGAARDVAIDPFGDIVALFEGRIAGGSQDVVLVKYTVEGTLAWALRYDGDAGLDDEAWGLAIDGLGGVHAVVSETTAQVVDDDGGTFDMSTVILGLDPEGELMWRFDHEAPTPAIHTSNGRAAAIDATGSALAVLLGPTWNGNAPTEVVVLDNTGDALFEFERPDIGEPLGVEITAGGDLVLAGGADDDKWLARVAVDGRELWHRSDFSPQIWRGLSLGPADEVFVLADWGDALGETGTTVRRFASDGTPAANHVVATYDEIGSSTDIAADCAGGAAVSAIEWSDGDGAGRLAHVDASGAPWSLVPKTTDITSAPSNVAVDLSGTIAIVGGPSGAWLARYAVP